MRKYPDTDKDRIDLAKLKPEDWMVDLLKLNPEYVHWGPHEDYMCSGIRRYRYETATDGNLILVQKSPEEIKDEYGNGWREPVFCESWKDFDLELDDWNEVVNFYFEVERDGKTCTACEGSGYNFVTKQLADNWYDGADTGQRWCDKLTQDEVDALVAKGRLWDLVKEADGCVPTAEQVNKKCSSEFVHDAINRWICIETRAKRMGVYGKCPTCEGEGAVFTEPTAHVNLILWVLFPRKGASCGMEVKNIQRDELPEVLSFLRQAAQRNADRFSKVVEL